MNTPLYEEKYKGYHITVDYDNFVDEEMMQGDNEIQLHCDDRSLSIGNKEYAPKNISLRTVLELLSKQRIFTGYYMEHSNVCLKDYEEITKEQVYEFINLHIDINTTEIVEFDEYTLYDMISNPIMITADKESHDDEVYGFWDWMNDYIQGQCYNICIEERKECKCCEQEVTEVLDTTSWIGDYDDALDNAREIIDRY